MVMVPLLAPYSLECSIVMNLEKYHTDTVKSNGHSKPLEPGYCYFRHSFWRVGYCVCWDILLAQFCEVSGVFSEEYSSSRLQRLPAIGYIGRLF